MVRENIENKPEIPEAVTGARGKGLDKETKGCLKKENKEIFSKMSEGGKNIANQVYESLYKIPGVNRVVGKLEIAYNQFWMNKHEKKVIEFKNKMENLNLRASAFDQSKKEIESVIEKLKQQRFSGIESLQLKLKEIDQEKAELFNKKDKMQSKFEYRDNKKKLYTNERDRVADKLIGRYNEKLEPMEKELENLQTYKDQTDLLIAVTEVKHKEQITKLGNIEKRKTQVEEALRRTGMSEKEIRKFEAVKTFKEFLASGREKIRIEKENLAQKKAEINKKIAKVDSKANPYRDKREEFVRVKEGRPLKMEVETRKRGEEFKGEEEVKAHPRGEGIETVGTGEEAMSRELEQETEEENKERLEVQSYISQWNVYLEKEYGKNASRELIDGNEFLKKTGFSENNKLDFNDFKNILEKYYKVKKVPRDKFSKSIDKFFEKKIKVVK